ncbi:MAG: hypothetical protein ACRCSV_01100 [Chlamydiales bacterium]
MNSFLNKIPEKFTVEQAFTISMLFFYELWSLVEPKVLDQERITGTSSLFFVTICTGDESSAEWNEAIYRFMKIPKEKQRNLNLTVDETFDCAIEFCKHHNKRYENRLFYAVVLLESMKKHPELHQDEWKCWDKAIKDTVENYMNDDSFNWFDELPTWPEKISNTIG